MTVSIPVLNRLAVALVAGGLALPSAALADDQIHILGWLEKAHITSGDIRMDAKLDTGAKTSAIHAEILSRDDLSENELLEMRVEDEEEEEVEEETDEPSDGRRRTVVFRLTNEDGEERILEREVIRTVRIKRRAGGVERRPVVELEVCIAGIPVSGEVSLADRTTFNYELLVGREMLSAANIAVHPEFIYTARARC